MRSRLESKPGAVAPVGSLDKDSTTQAGRTGPQSVTRPEYVPGKAPQFPATVDVTAGRRRSMLSISRWKEGFRGLKESRSSVITSAGPLGTWTASQQPGDPGRKVAAPRFEGDGKLSLLPEEQETLRNQAQQAIDAVGQSASQSKSKLSDKWGRWTKQGLSLVGLSKGPSPRRSDVVKFAEREGAGAAATQGTTTGDLQALHSYLHTKADLEIATSGIRFVEAARGETISPEIVKMNAEVATKHAEAADEILKNARLQRESVLQSLAGDAPPEIRSRILNAATCLFERLDKKGMVVGQGDRTSTLPDVLASRTLAQAVLHLFGSANEQAAQALESLAGATGEGLVRGVALALNESRGVTTNEGILDPLIRLAAEISSLDGGARLLAESIADAGASNEKKEALRVALGAAGAMQDQILSTGKITVDQRNFLQAAVRHSQSLIEGPPADLSAAQRKQQRVAYRAVQNGITSDESGSAFKQVEAKLNAFTVPPLTETAKRNARAATGRAGRATNWVTAATSEKTFWRKSNLRDVTAGLANNGMLPTRADAIDTLNKTATDVRVAAEALQGPNGDKARADLGRLMLSVLDAVGLGNNGELNVPEKSLKHLGKSFFKKVEEAVGRETIERLPPAFKENWAAMKGAHPNVGQVLLLLNEHLDLREPELAGGGAPSTSLTQRGAYTDRLVLRAMDDFKNLAHYVRNAAADDVFEGKSTERLQMAELAVAMHQALVEVQKNSAGEAVPSALRLALRTEVFEAIEYKLAMHLMDQREAARLPPISVHDARTEVMASWPQDVRDAWTLVKKTAPDAGRLMRFMCDRVASEAMAGGRDGPLSRAEASLSKLQEDVHINRFELAVADALTTFNDVRSGRDAAAALRSITHRFCLGEKVKGADGRQVSVDVGKTVTLLGSHGALGMLAPSAGAARNSDNFFEMSMSGATLQMFIGDTDSTIVFGGLAVGIRGMIGGDNHEVTLDEGKAGLALRADIKLEATHETAQVDAVGLRIPRVSGQEDQMRREMGDILCDVVRDEFNGQRLANLLDRHPNLSVAGVQTKKKTRTSETSGGLTALVRFGMRKGHDAAGLGGSALLAAKTQIQTTAQTEVGGDLKVEEFKISAQQRTEFRAVFQAPVSLLPSKEQHEKVGTWGKDTRFNPQVKGAGVEYRKQFANSGLDSTVRRVMHKGATVAQQSQQIREFEDFDSLLEEVKTRQGQYLTVLANADPVPGATAHEKLVRARERLNAVLDQAQREAGPNMTITMVTRMRDEVARAYDMLLASATLAERSGDTATARNFRRDAEALLLNDNAWTALNLQFKSKTKSDTAQSATLGVHSAKTASESTRLHEFLPLGAQRVGRSLDMPKAVPGCHSRRWLGVKAEALSTASPEVLSSWAEVLVGLRVVSVDSDEGLMMETDSSTPWPGSEARPSVTGHSDFVTSRVNPQVTGARVIVGRHKELEESTRGQREERRTGEELTQQWHGSVDSTMHVLEEILELQVPDMTGLEQAAEESSTIGWAPPGESSLSDMLDDARERGLAAVESQFNAIVASFQAADEAVTRLSDLKPKSGSGSSSPQEQDLEIANQLVAVEQIAFDAAEAVDEGLEKLAATGTHTIRTFMEMSQDLRRIQREADNARQRAEAAHSALTRAKDAVALQRDEVARIVERRSIAEAESADVVALDVQVAYATAGLRNAEAALKGASFEAGAAIQRAQALVMETELSLEAVSRTFDVAGKIHGRISQAMHLHRESQKLVDGVNANARPAVARIESALLLRSRTATPPSKPASQRTPETVSDRGSSLQLTSSGSLTAEPQLQLQDHSEIVSDRESASQRSRSASPPPEPVSEERPNLEESLEADDELTDTDTDTISTSTQVPRQLRRAQSDALNARERAEAARLALDQATDAVKTQRLLVAELKARLATGHDSVEAEVLASQVTAAGAELRNAIGALRIAAADADAANRRARVLMSQVDRQIEAWTGIEVASQGSGEASPTVEPLRPRARRPQPEERSSVQEPLVVQTPPGTSTIRTSTQAPEAPNRTADARHRDELAGDALRQAENAARTLHDRLSALTVKRLDVEPGSAYAADLDRQITEARAEWRIALPAFRAATAEADAAQRAQALEAEANRSAEQVPPPRRRSRLRRLATGFRS